MELVGYIIRFFESPSVHFIWHFALSC